MRVMKGYARSWYRWVALLVVILGILFVESISAAQAADAFGEGNVLVANGSTVTEYTTSGAVVQTIPIEPREGQETVLVRDVVVDRFGRMHVMTMSPGAFMASEQAYLSTFDPQTDAWEHNTIDGWSLSSVTYYGGISVSDDYVFAPDLQTGGGEGDGIIRFPLSDLSAPERFHEVDGAGYNLWHTVKVGHDGNVCALERGPGIDNLRCFDPDTMEELNAFSLYHEASMVSVATDADGNIFTLNLDGDLHRHDASGTLLQTAENTGGGVDMELAADGTLLLGSAGTTITLTNTLFDEFSSFEVPGGDGLFGVNFVAYVVPVPEPSALLLTASGLLGLLVWWWKRAARA